VDGVQSAGAAAAAKSCVGVQLSCHTAIQRTAFVERGPPILVETVGPEPDSKLRAVIHGRNTQACVVAWLGFVGGMGHAAVRQASVSVLTWRRWACVDWASLFLTTEFSRAVSSRTRVYMPITRFPKFRDGDGGGGGGGGGACREGGEEGGGCGGVFLDRHTCCVRTQTPPVSNHRCQTLSFFCFCSTQGTVSH
jgi:hypothetical protein